MRFSLLLLLLAIVNCQVDQQQEAAETKTMDTGHDGKGIEHHYAHLSLNKYVTGERQITQRDHNNQIISSKKEKYQDLRSSQMEVYVEIVLDKVAKRPLKLTIIDVTGGVQSPCPIVFNLSNIPPYPTDEEGLGDHAHINKNLFRIEVTSKYSTKFTIVGFTYDDQNNTPGISSYSEYKSGDSRTTRFMYGRAKKNFSSNGTSYKIKDIEKFKAHFKEDTSGSTSCSDS